MVQNQCLKPQSFTELLGTILQEPFSKYIHSSVWYHFFRIYFLPPPPMCSKFTNRGHVGRDYVVTFFLHILFCTIWYSKALSGSISKELVGNGFVVTLNNTLRSDVKVKADLLLFENSICSPWPTDCCFCDEVYPRE